MVDDRGPGTVRTKDVRSLERSWGCVADRDSCPCKKKIKELKKNKKIKKIKKSQQKVSKLADTHHIDAKKNATNQLTKPATHITLTP